MVRANKQNLYRSKSIDRAHISLYGALEFLSHEFMVLTETPFVALCNMSRPYSHRLSISTPTRQRNKNHSLLHYDVSDLLCLYVYTHLCDYILLYFTFNALAHTIYSLFDWGPLFVRTYNRAQICYRRSSYVAADINK